MSLLFILNFIIIINNVNSFNYDLNKVVIHKPPYLKNTNFGYSVAGYKVDNDSWILVGAPLTLRERPHQNTNKEGAIYRCKINTPNSCFMLPFDKRDDWHEVRDQYGIYYNENKTNQLLGATLKVSNDVIMACAPNYRYVTRVFKQEEFRYEPTGICYTLKDKMRKFEEYAPCKNSMWGYHRQGFCQAGFSAALSYSSASLVISGPGAWYWQGMVFALNLTNKEIKHRYPEKSGEGKEDDSYRGYSLDIGHFDNDTVEDIVVSAPRGSNCKGFVEVFSSALKLLHVINGYQIGAYFGASVIVTDINNDSYDDIIIGSPLYRKDKENYDIGRIDIYIRDTKNLNTIKFINTNIDGHKPASRFGYTLAKLGDVNDDGYNDIAVAAPYDDNNNGIVYIYHGNSNGLNKIPDQIIKGSSYNLKTFGYSLSGNLDLDHNKYPDLIIGAYKSDAAALIRSRPVVKSTVTIQTTPRVIDLDSRTSLCDKNKDFICMELEMCVQYNGKSVPSVLRMKLIWELDIEKSYNDSRALFYDTNTNILTQNFTFKYDVKKCVKEIIQIKKSIRDKLTPIKCRFNKMLPIYDSDWELMPIFDNKHNTTKVHEVRFLKNCGNDDICVPNLQVTASTPSKKYIYGSRFNIDINIQVFNKKEDAFESQCIITLPYGVNYVKTFSSPTFMANQAPLQCTQSKSETNETRVICDIGNPIVSNTGKSFTIRVAPENILPDQEVLMFNVTVTSSNKEDKSTIVDNEHHVYVVLDAIPGLTLIGKQYQEQVVYETRFDETSHLDYVNETQIGPEIMHEYKIINKGPSEFSKSELLITWQSQLEMDDKKLSFMYLMETPYLEGPIKCNIDYKLINPLNISVLEGDSLRNPEKYFKSSSLLDQIYEPFRVLRSFNTESDYYLHSLERYINCASGIYKKEKKKDESIINKRGINYLNYKKSDLYDFYCGSIHCDIDHLKTDESAIIRLRFRLWASTLALDSEVYSVKSFGTAIVTETPYEKINLDLDSFQSSTQIETIAHPRERKQISQPLDLWIVFLSIFAGVILLVLLIILLWCCGFFKRFEPQEMTKFGETMSSEDETGTNDVIDISKQCIMHTSNTLDKNTLLLKSPPPQSLTSSLLPLPPPPPPPPLPTLQTSLSISASSLISSPQTQQQQQQKSRSNHKIATHLNNLYSDITKQNKQTNNDNNSTSDHQLHNQSTISSSVYILPVNKTTNEINDSNNLIKSSPSQSVKFSTFYSNNNNKTNNHPTTTSSTNPTTTTTTTNSSLTNDTYTTKLPPVPKRNNFNNNNNTNNIYNLINLNQKLSNSNNKINDNSSSTAKYAIINAAILNNNNYQNDKILSNSSTRGSFDTMNYKMLTKQQQQQQQNQQQLANLNKNNAGYATYRSPKTQRTTNNNSSFDFTDNKRLNLKNEHNI